jgi:hypothetical protein
MKNSIRFVLGSILLFTLTVPYHHAAHLPFTQPETLSTVHAPEACSFDNKASMLAPITWFPVEIECPVCKTKNIFLQWGSYGSYIYLDPSKYQLIFWPYTDSAAWYSCKKCHLTAFMEDFKKIPADKIPALSKMLESVVLPPQKERSKDEAMEHPPYLEIPSWARLVVAEKVYRTLGITKGEFWEHFYRVMGYHFDADKKQPEADESRRKSLALLERLLADKTNEGHRKVLLYVSGAMKHFLRDDAGALRDFEEAKTLTYSDKDSKPEDSKGYNEYLSKLINEYVETLRKGGKLPT